MPYIEQQFRDRLDPAIDNLVEAIRIVDIETRGNTNYAITRILVGVFLRHQSYADFLKAVGTLEMAKLELYRRMAAPYEDRKRDRNGEVY